MGRFGFPGVPKARVLASRDDLHVADIHAASPPARVVDVHSFGDGGHQRFVSEAVDCEPLAALLQVSVLLPARNALPNPAAASRDVYPLPEPFEQRGDTAPRRSPVSVTVFPPSVVVALTPPASQSGMRAIGDGTL